MGGGGQPIIIHAGGEMGFVPNALAMWKAGTKTRDYDYHVKSTNCFKWAQEKLIQNIPEKSLIVTDNAPYHHAEIRRRHQTHEKTILRSGYLRKISLSPEIC
jgi:hypothetical protein